MHNLMIIAIITTGTIDNLFMKVYAMLTHATLIVAAAVQYVDTVYFTAWIRINKKIQR